MFEKGDILKFNTSTPDCDAFKGEDAKGLFLEVSYDDGDTSIEVYGFRSFKEGKVVETSKMVASQWVRRGDVFLYKLPKQKHTEKERKAAALIVRKTLSKLNKEIEKAKEVGIDVNVDTVELEMSYQRPKPPLYTY